MENKTVLVNVKKLAEDFSALNSSPREVRQSLADSGLNSNLFSNWKHRMSEEGTLGVRISTLEKISEISGLSYKEYIIPNAKPTRKPYMSRLNVHSKKLNNGVVVTTYRKDEESSESNSTQETSIMAMRISSFKSHMEIYRKLLGLSRGELEESFKISGYSEIEAGNAVLSISTYFNISKVFIDTYNDLKDSPLKKAFYDLASAYNDIYVSIVYFGDAYLYSSKEHKGRV